MTKKAFALGAIAPYYKNPSTCGYEGDGCYYLTEDGRMCVVGKHMLNPKDDKLFNMDSFRILTMYSQKEVLKPEFVGILSASEWQTLQDIHDCLATGSINVEKYINSSELFTLEELKEFCL